jgi:hypothetical protein
MALVVKDRVQETSTTTGTGSLTLLGAVTGFQTFSSAIGNTNTTYYTIQNGAEWEVGVGTVSAGALSRDTVLESSNGGSLVNFSAGSKFVFCTYPAEKSVDIETTQTLTNKIISGASNTLSNIANASLTNSAITINGTSTSLGGSINVGTVTSVSGTSPVASSGGNTPAISLASGYGDTQNPYASKTAKFVLAAPNAADGVPTFRAIVASDIPTLNQDTTGSAATVTGNATGSTFGFNSGYGSVATAYGCRAWVRFNGIGTVAVIGSGNVSSVTDVGTGLYRINFATSMPDANFTAVGNCAQADSNQNGTYGDFITFYSYDATDVNISTLNDSNSTASLADMENVTAAIFR